MLVIHRMPALSTSLSSQFSSIIIGEIKVLVKRRRPAQGFWKYKLVMGKMGKPLDPTKTEVSGLEVENKQTNKQAKHFTAFGAKKKRKKRACGL